jgi:phenylalanyl-tRNA synthetase beta chain
VRAAESADEKLVAGVTVFDLFESDALGPGKKSLAIQVTLQPTGKTLTDEEIDAVGRKVIAEVSRATGGVLRG